MVTRRAAIAGGLTAAAVAAVGGVAALSGGGGSAVRTLGSAAPAPTTGRRETSAPSTAVPDPSDDASGTEQTRVTAVEAPATVSTPADRLDAPLTVDWVGGSDVAWEGVSLPDRFVEYHPLFADRPVDMRTRIRQAVMAGGVRELVGEARAARTTALIMSINPVWLHWDEAACSDLAVQHERYRCLLSPISPSLSAQRADELGALVDAAVGVGVPLYVYTQPHSTDSLSSPLLADVLEEAEERIAAYDPGSPRVRFRARIFTRDMDPLVEGVDFIDMVHPTQTGVARLGRWLADDITDFWRSIGFAE